MGRDNTDPSKRNDQASLAGVPQPRWKQTETGAVPSQAQSGDTARGNQKHWDARKAEEHNAALFRAPLAGLLAPRKAISQYWMYDAQGIEHLKQVAADPNYSLYRAEMEVLRDRTAEVHRQLTTGCELIDLGSGDGEKALVLLASRPDITSYIPVDVDQCLLEDVAGKIAQTRKDVQVSGIKANFMNLLDLPEGKRDRVVLFLGATIGNLTQEESVALLQNIRQWQGVRRILIGFDLRKDEKAMLAAYESPAMAALVMNALVRLRCDLQVDFDMGAFEHHCYWSDQEQSIISGVRCRYAHRLDLGGHRVAFAAGEFIRIVSSRKYTIETIHDLAHLGGWKLTDTGLDRLNSYALTALAPV